MSNRLSTYGNVIISTPTDIFTVKDVRDFIGVLDSLNVPDETVLDDGFLVYEHQTKNVQVITCAEHGILDYIIPTHKCGDTNE